MIVTIILYSVFFCSISFLPTWVQLASDSLCIFHLGNILKGAGCLHLILFLNVGCFIDLCESFNNCLRRHCSLWSHDLSSLPRKRKDMHETICVAAKTLLLRFLVLMNSKKTTKNKLVLGRYFIMFNIFA